MKQTIFLHFSAAVSHKTISTELQIILIRLCKKNTATEKKYDQRSPWKHLKYYDASKQSLLGFHKFNI